MTSIFKAFYDTKAKSSALMLGEQVRNVVSNPNICGLEKGTQLLQLATVRDDQLEKNYLSAVAVDLMTKCIAKHAAEERLSPVKILKSFGSQNLTKMLTCGRCGHEFATEVSKGKRITCMCGNRLVDW